MGAICRNEVGESIGAVCDWKYGCISVEAAESKALLLGVRLARWLGVKNVVFESDCLNVVRLLNQRGKQLHYFGNIIADVLKEAKDLNYGSFLHIGREGNGPAHILLI